MFQSRPVLTKLTQLPWFLNFRGIVKIRQPSSLHWSFFVGGPIPGLMAIALGPIPTPTVAVTALLGNRSFDCRCFSAFLAGNIDCCRRIVICAAIGYGGVRIQG